MQNKNIIYILVGAAFILLIPLSVMLIGNQVNWSMRDFITAYLLLAGTGIIYELITRRINNVSYRIAIGIVLGIGLLLIWIELAVGIWS